MQPLVTQPRGGFADAGVPYMKRYREPPVTEFNGPSMTRVVTPSGNFAP